MRYHDRSMVFPIRKAGFSVRAGVTVVVLLAAFPARAEGQRASFQALDADEPIPAYISPEKPGNRSGDRQLAEWALEAWAQASGGSLSFRFADEESSRLRLYWVSAQNNLYGEMHPIQVEGRRGAAVFVRPEIDGLGGEIAALARSDPLFRDTIVYLTCLHEIGHALGLQHTASYDDIMFFFGYGGDIPNYFGRYRRMIEKRGDIATNWGLSEPDIRRLRRLYPPPDAGPALSEQD